MPNLVTASTSCWITLHNRAIKIERKFMTFSINYMIYQAKEEKPLLLDHDNIFLTKFTPSPFPIPILLLALEAEAARPEYGPKNTLLSPVVILAPEHLPK